MAYQVDPRFIEGAALDRITKGGRGISAGDQRDLANRGLMPSSQMLKNQRLNDLAASNRQADIDRETVKQNRLKTQAMELQMKQAQGDYRDQLHAKAYPSSSTAKRLGMGMYAPNFQAGSSRPQGGSSAQPQGMPPAGGSSRYQYDIDSRAARDAGNLSRAIAGYMNNGTAESARSVLDSLNGTPFSSITGATGIRVDTGNGGRERITFTDGNGKDLGTFDVQRALDSLGNLNNYTQRNVITTTPGRKALLDSKELAAGAEAARAAAMQPPEELGFTQQEDGRWTRPKTNKKTGKSEGFEVYYPENYAGKGQQAYDDFIEQYGARQPETEVNRDVGFYKTQTPVTYERGGEQAPLGFATGLRYTPETPDTEDPNNRTIEDLVAEAIGGNGGKGDPEVDDLPPPEEGEEEKRNVRRSRYAPGMTRAQVPEPVAFTRGGRMQRAPSYVAGGGVYPGLQDWFASMAVENPIQPRRSRYVAGAAPTVTLEDEEYNAGL